VHRWLAGLIAAMLWIAAPVAVMAHTGITVSSPTDGEVIADELKRVEMTFSTTFEKALSKATLLDEAGEEVPYAELIQGDKSMSLRFEEPLPSGAYTVNWKLLGADGHAVEGSYTFSVNLPEAEAEQPVEQEQPAEAEQPANAEQPAEAEQPVAEAPQAADETEPAADPEPAAEEPVKSEAPAASPPLLGSGGMIAVVAAIAVLAFFLIRNIRKQ
jgi:copper resistance protein C